MRVLGGNSPCTCHNVCRVVGGSSLFRLLAIRRILIVLEWFRCQTTNAKIQTSGRFLEAQEVMGEGFNGTMGDIQVDMESSPEQSCHQQDPRRGQSIALKGPSGRRGIWMQRLGLVFRRTDIGQHKMHPTEKNWGALRPEPER